jgi:hypothetical protein
MSGFEDEIGVGTVIPFRERAPELGNLTIGAYIQGGLDHEVIDPLNAARLLGGNTRELLTQDTRDGLLELTRDHDGSPVDERIVAPLLRVLDDFEVGSPVMFRGNTEVAGWEFEDVIALDDGDQETGPVVVFGPSFRTYVTANPQNPRLFTERDNNVLNLRELGRRPNGLPMAARFVLGLSMFDQTIKTEKDFIKGLEQIHNHFDFKFDPEFFVRKTST